MENELVRYSRSLEDEILVILIDTADKAEIGANG
jgi:hypothetical protein